MKKQGLIFTIVLAFIIALALPNLVQAESKYKIVINGVEVGSYDEGEEVVIISLLIENGYEPMLAHNIQKVEWVEGDPTSIYMPSRNLILDANLNEIEGTTTTTEPSESENASETTTTTEPSESESSSKTTTTATESQATSSESNTSVSTKSSAKDNTPKTGSLNVALYVPYLLIIIATLGITLSKKQSKYSK